MTNNNSTQNKNTNAAQTQPNTDAAQHRRNATQTHRNTDATAKPSLYPQESSGVPPAPQPTAQIATLSLAQPPSPNRNFGAWRPSQPQPPSPQPPTATFELGPAQPWPWSRQHWLSRGSKSLEDMVFAHFQPMTNPAAAPSSST